MARSKIDIGEIRQALSSLSGIPSNDVDGFLEAFFLVGKAKRLLEALKEEHQRLSWKYGSRCIGTIRMIPRELRNGSVVEDMRVYHPAGQSCPRCGEYKTSKKVRRIEKTVAKSDWEDAVKAVENHKRLCEIDVLISQTINVVGMIESSLPTEKVATLRDLLTQGRQLARPEDGISTSIIRKSDKTEGDIPESIITEIPIIGIGDEAEGIFPKA